MSWAAVAIGGSALLSYQSQQQNRASQQAANAQNMQLSREGTAEGARQFDIGREDQIEMLRLGEDRYGFDVQRMDEMAGSRRTREDQINQMMQGRFDTLRGENVARLDPYSQAGGEATERRAAFMGLRGKGAEQEARAGFTERAGQRFLRERAEKALLRSRSKIGGLGGGNVRTALQEQAIGIGAGQEQQYLENLRALSGEGLSAGQTVAGMRGPEYVKTHTDTGVGTTAYTPADLSGFTGKPKGSEAPTIEQMIQQRPEGYRPSGNPIYTDRSYNPENYKPNPIRSKRKPKAQR